MRARGPQHADLNTLALLSGYDCKQLGHGNWYRNQTDEQAMLDLLKSAAEKLGMKLIKQPAPKKRTNISANTTVSKPQQLRSEQPQTAAAAALGIDVGTSAALYLTKQDAIGQATTVKDKPMDGADLGD